jgi:uncharacterized protein
MKTEYYQEKLNMTYHLRRKDREVTEPGEIENIIKNNKYAVIGLCRDNEPYVVTMDYGFDPSQKALYFHCAKEGKKIDFIKSNSKACVTILEDNGYLSEECDHSFQSLVLSGTMELADNPGETDTAIKLLIAQLEKKDPEKFIAKLTENNPSYNNLQIIKFKIEGATGKKRTGK